MVNLKTLSNGPRRFVLCQPRGGLNDTLCQIEICWRYADRFGRTLILDTRKCGLYDQFSRYFIACSPSTDVLLECDDAFLSDLNLGTVRPGCLEGTLHDFKARWLIKNFAHVEIDEWLTFDQDLDHPESCLVHHQCGGGKDSFDCLKRLKFVESTARDIRQRLAMVPEDYDAVHIRHTDYKTDYATLFRKIYRHVEGRSLLICSDSAQVIETARSFFDKSRVFTLSEIPDTRGRGLHSEKLSTEDQYLRNLDTLTDLLGLALAESLYINPVKNPYPMSLNKWLRPWTWSSRPLFFSGYSMLARFLHENPDVVSGLLGESSAGRADGIEG